VAAHDPGGVGDADVLVVSLGTTGGWRAAARELASSLERAGASVAMVEAGPARRMRTFVLTDLAQALSTRRVAQAGPVSRQRRLGWRDTGPVA
jgi:hypothetical protein